MVTCARQKRSGCRAHFPPLCALRRAEHLSASSGPCFPGEICEIIGLAKKALCAHGRFHATLRPRGGNGSDRRWSRMQERRVGDPRRRIRSGCEAGAVLAPDAGPTSAADGAGGSTAIDGSNNTAIDGSSSMVTSISKDGVTWTFSAPVLAGQFVTGDWWIVGPATVTAISPAPTTATPFLNGSVVNLPTSNGKSPFDSRLNDGTDESWWFDASFRSYPPVSLKAGDSLVSSISLATATSLPEVMRASDKSCSPVRSDSVLTVLSARSACGRLQARPTATGARRCIARVRCTASFCPRTRRPTRRARPLWRSSRRSSGARGSTPTPSCSTRPPSTCPATASMSRSPSATPACSCCSISPRPTRNPHQLPRAIRDRSLRLREGGLRLAGIRRPPQRAQAAHRVGRASAARRRDEERLGDLPQPIRRGHADRLCQSDPGRLHARPGRAPR